MLEDEAQPTEAATPTDDVGGQPAEAVGKSPPAQEQAPSEPVGGGKKAKAAAPPAEPVEPTEEPKSTLPEDWREQLAGDDKVLLKQLQRLKSFQDVGKKVSEQEKLIRSAQHKQPLPADATEEQVAEYRKANGIPEAPEGYLDALEGLVVGDEDKPAIESFLQSAHAANADPKFVKTAVDWYYQQQQATSEAEAARDGEYRAEAREQLMEAMGPDYKVNMQGLKTWLSQEEGLFDAVMGARAPDGTLLGDNPQVINFLTSAMRELNPISTVLPGVSTGGAQVLQDEISGIEDMMKTKEGQEKYWGSKQLQDRYNQLLAAKEKMDRKSA